MKKNNIGGKFAKVFYLIKKAFILLGIGIIF